MGMLFRTFNGYIRDDKKWDFTVPSNPDDGPGLGIVYSWSYDYNLYCFNGGRGYYEHCLRDYNDWRKTFKESLDFMRQYEEIGCATITTEQGSRHKSKIVTEYVNFPIYDGYKGIDSFYVIFNACPAVHGRSHFVKIGKSIYSLKLDFDSVIVWNLEKYADLECLKDFTIWGIHDGEFVGMKNGKVLKVK